MSKNSVGDVYDKVIKEVCDQSRVDFEEGGVELATLELLQSEWQKKLSQLRVTQLPWDPAPSHAKESGLSSSSKSHQTLPSNGNSIKVPPPTQAVSSMSPIKQEPTRFPSQVPVPQSYATPSFSQGQEMSAHDRAAMNLHQKYGPLAGAQISQLQQTGHSRVPGPVSGSPNAGIIKEEDHKPSQTSLDDYRPTTSQSSTPPIKASQNDGAGEASQSWASEYKRRKNFAAKNRTNAGRLMKEHFRQTQQQLEAGGLLLPLEEQQIYLAGPPKSLAARRDQKKGNTQESVIKNDEHAHQSHLARSQGDASGDVDDEDDEDDENAINSDLDDPDELAANDDNGENTDQVMLCTYDKVQRVKNKWKCTLKDGILRIDGTEYVFHKGQGEFEW